MENILKSRLKMCKFTRKKITNKKKWWAPRWQLYG